MKTWQLCIIVFSVAFIFTLSFFTQTNALPNGWKLSSELEGKDPPDPVTEPSITSSYTPSSETHCNEEGKCTVSLYSRVKYVEEENKWIKLEESKGSLMDYFNVVYLEKDDNLEITVKDFTYDSIDFEFKIKDAGSLKKEIPIKIAGIEKTRMNFDKLTDVKSFRYTTTEKNDSILFHNYTFGEHSTTIQLQDADTENLDDTWANDDANKENYEYGSCTYIRVIVEGYDNRYGYLKFNLLSIPADSTINNATLYLYLYEDEIDIGEGMDVGVRHVYSNPTYNIGGAEWTEGDQCDGFGTDPELDWNNKPDVGEMNTTVESYRTYSTAAPIGWHDWSVTNMVTKSYTDGDDNISIEIYPYNEDALEDTDWVHYYSKEYTGDTSLRPILKITYTEAAAGDTCDYSSGDWIIDCSENCIIDTNTDIGANDIYFTGTGAITLDADIIVRHRYWGLPVGSCELRYVTGKRITETG